MTTEVEQLKLEIDGAGVEPLTVDALKALELAAAFLDMVEGIAQSKGGTMAFRGIEVYDKCCQFRVTPSAPKLAEACAMEADRILRGVLPPGAGLSSRTTRLRKAVREHSREGLSVHCSILGWSSKLEAEPVKFDLLPESTISLRVRVLIAGGEPPTVRFTSGSEGDSAFVLKTDEQTAALAGRYLYKPADIVATIRRDETGSIAGGRLLDFRPVDTEQKPATSWLNWLDENGRGWDGVTDILGELGRGD